MRIASQSSLLFSEYLLKGQTDFTLATHQEILKLSVYEDVTLPENCLRHPYELLCVVFSALRVKKEAEKR